MQEDEDDFLTNIVVAGYNQSQKSETWYRTNYICLCLNDNQTSDQFSKMSPNSKRKGKYMFLLCKSNSPNFHNIAIEANSCETAHMLPNQHNRLFTFFKKIKFRLCPCMSRANINFATIYNINEYIYRWVPSRNILILSDDYDYDCIIHYPNVILSNTDLLTYLWTRIASIHFGGRRFVVCFCVFRIMGEVDNLFRDWEIKRGKKKIILYSLNYFFLLMMTWPTFKLIAWMSPRAG